MRQFPYSIGAAAFAALLAIAAGTGAVRANEPATPAAPPLAAGDMRLTLKLDERSVSFKSTLAPLARRTMTFEGQDHAPTESMREAAQELAQALSAAAKPDGAFVVMAYAADPLVAYRRARAVRGALIERHQVAAARLVAAGRAASGHVGGATIVDIYGVDPAGCSGCGDTPFRSIAYDSGTMRLVTALPETLAASAPAPGPNPAASPTPSGSPAPIARPERPSAQRHVAPAPAMPSRAVRMPAAAPTQRAAMAGCRRPRIIIDDYYPGGPMVPCRPLR